MKKQKTVERWAAEVFNMPELNHKADQKDRQIDHRVGRQQMKLRKAAKTPETDWRSLTRL